MRLISFLGTGSYGETTYAFGDKTCTTKYIMHSLATFLGPTEIHVISTKEAWSQHGAVITQILTDDQLPVPLEVCVPTSGAPEELWKMFSSITESIRTSNCPVILDITHGFRMQPFLAAACIQYVQAVIPNPPPIRVVYGEYRKEEQTSPIWELTPFLDVLSWSRNLMMFLHTGQADAVVEPTKLLGRDLSKQWADTGKKGSQPQLAKLSDALQKFGDDLTTVRTGSLLIGDSGSAKRLEKAINQTRAEVQQHLPALAMVLDQVRAMIDPILCEGRLSAPPGQSALLSLARLYQKMGRYSESISILREGWITLGAPAETDMPGYQEFNMQQREQQEKAWFNSCNSARSVAEIRNDIQHAGFQKQPLKKETFDQQLTTLLKAWEDTISASRTSS